MVFTRINSTLIAHSRSINYFSAAAMGPARNSIYGSTGIPFIRQKSTVNAYSMKPPISQIPLPSKGNVSTQVGREFWLFLFVLLCVDFVLVRV